MNAKIIRILIHSLPDPTIIYNTNSYKKYLLCCTTYKSVFDTPNQSVTFTPKTR